MQLESKYKGRIKSRRKRGIFTLAALVRGGQDSNLRSSVTTG